MTSSSFSHSCISIFQPIKFSDKWQFTSTLIIGLIHLNQYTCGALITKSPSCPYPYIYSFHSQYCCWKWSPWLWWDPYSIAWEYIITLSHSKTSCYHPTAQQCLDNLMPSTHRSWRYCTAQNKVYSTYGLRWVPCFIYVVLLTWYSDIVFCYLCTIYGQLCNLYYAIVAEDSSHFPPYVATIWFLVSEMFNH